MIIIIGLPGSGKSFFAHKFSKIFKAPHIDYAFYRHRATNQTAAGEIITDTTEKILLTKQTLLIEGTGHNKKTRSDLAQIARKHSYKLLYVWVQTDTATAAQRAIKSKESPTTRYQFDQAAKNFQAPEKATNYVVISGKHTYQTQAKSVLKKLVAERQPLVPEVTVEDPRRKAFFRNRIMG